MTVSVRRDTSFTPCSASRRRWWMVTRSMLLHHRVRVLEHLRVELLVHAFYEFGHKVKKLMRPDVQRAHSLHQFAKVQDLMAKQFRWMRPKRSARQPRIRVAAAKHVDLHFNADEQTGRPYRAAALACDPGALGCAGTRTGRNGPDNSSNRDH